jgi:hypothetical protein
MKLRKRSQVAEMSADELHRAIVEDFVNHIYPDTLHGLGTQIAAVKKIADARGQTVEVAFRAILEEAQALGADTPSTFNGALQ